MKTKGILLLIILVALPLLDGCWSRVELNDLSFITAAAVDKTDDGKVLLTLQIAVPTMNGQAGGAGGRSGGGGNGGGRKPSSVTVSEQGETILDAYHKLQVKLPRKLFYSHNRILVVGEKMAQGGVSPVLDFFSRYRESRLRIYILFTKGKAADILNMNPKWEKISAEELRQEEKSRVGLSVFLMDFYNMLLSDGMEPVAGQVGPRAAEAGKESDSGRGKERNAAIIGAAVFRKDKLTGWLNEKEVNGALWLRNELKDAVATIDIPQEKGGGKVSVRITKAETKIKPVIRNSEVNIQVYVRAEDELYESSSKLDLSRPESIRYVEKALEEDVTGMIRLTVEKSQELKSDLFGFGQEVYRSHPQAWKKRFKERWDQDYPQLEVNIAAHVEVSRTGLTSKSLMWDEKELKKE